MAVQATDFRQRSSQGFAPALPYSVPPPNYLSPLVVGSPQSSGQFSGIPIAAPNSPATPKTPVSFQYPTYPYYPAPMLGSPMSRSPVPTATFQQHMMQYRPSPLVIPPRSPSPYIVQPISRSVPIVGFDAYEQANALAASLSARLNVDKSTPAGPIHTHNTFGSKCSSVNCYEI